MSPLIHNAEFALSEIFVALAHFVVGIHGINFENKSCN